MALDPSDLRDRAVESIAGGLAQMKHLRFHQKDNLSENSKGVLDRNIDVIYKSVTELADLDVNKK